MGDKPNSIRRKGKEKGTEPEKSNISINLAAAYTCRECNKEATENCIECDTCRQWLHRTCAGLGVELFNAITNGNPGVLYKCTECRTISGNEIKKLLRLEERMEQMMRVMTNQFANLEQTITNKIEKMIDSKVEERLKDVENKIHARITQDMEEKEDQERRKDNIVVWNLPESQCAAVEDRNKDDVEYVHAVLSKVMDINPDELTNPIRIGKRGDKPRLLKMTVTSSEKKKEIINCAKMINGKIRDPKSMVFINNDQTKQEREHFKKLRDELYQRRKNGETDIRIRGRDIVKFRDQQSEEKGRGSPTSGDSRH